MKTKLSSFLFLYETLPIPISVVDRDGRLLYYNAAAADAFDRKPDYIGQDIRRFHHKQMSIAKIDAILDYLRSPEHPQTTYEIERSGKNYRIVISRIEADGELWGFIQSALPLGLSGK